MSTDRLLELGLEVAALRAVSLPWVGPDWAI